MTATTTSVSNTCIRRNTPRSDTSVSSAVNRRRYGCGASHHVAIRKTLRLLMVVMAGRSNGSAMQSTFIGVANAVSVSSSENTPNIPWQEQQQQQSSKSKDVYYNELPVTVFAESGRLLKVERAVEQAANTNVSSENSGGGRSTTIVAIQLPQHDCVVIATVIHSDGNGKQSAPSKYMTPSVSATTSILWDIANAPNLNNHLQQYTDTVFGVTVGGGGSAAAATDAIVLANDIRQLSISNYAVTIKKSSKDRASAGTLARKLADLLQDRTQSSNAIVPCTTILTNGSALYKIIPSGQFYQCRCCVIGTSSRCNGVEKNLFQKLVSKTPTMKSAATSAKDVLSKSICKLSVDDAVQLIRDVVVDTDAMSNNKNGKSTNGKSSVSFVII